MAMTSMEYGIFDLDHTLSDSSFRDRLLKADRYDCQGLIASMTNRDWDNYHAHCGDDPPKSEVVRLYCGVRATKMRTIIVTARPVKYERQTRQWLKDHKIEFDHLLMRPANNKHPSSVLKIDLVAKLLGVNWSRRVAFVVDDHVGVIDAFGKFGVIGLLCKHNN